MFNIEEGKEMIMVVVMTYNKMGGVGDRDGVGGEL